LRAQSLNTRLALLAQRALERLDVEVDHASMHELACPSYDGDQEEQHGIPEPAYELRRRIVASKHYPCAKSRWVEFLGERPVPVLDRVQ